MLAKLLKNELRSTSRILGLLSLGALAVGGMGGLMLRYIVSYVDTGKEGALVILVSMMLMFVFLALICYSFGGRIYLYYQFYRRKYTDEGYLTFTLPAHSWQIFFSSLLNILLWSVVIGLVLILSLVLIFLIGLINSEFFRDMRQAMTQMEDFFQYEFYGSIPKFNTPLMLISGVLDSISSDIVVMTCITLGAIVAKKRKLLGSVGVYFGYSMLSNSITSTFMNLYLSGNTEVNINNYYIFMIIYTLIIAVGGSFLSCWIMKRKLNLP